MTTLELELTEPGDSAPRRVVLAQEAPWWLGRDATCAVVLASPKVSRRHACLRVQDGTVLLRDGSANGTFVNDEQVLRREIEVPLGAVIRVGAYVLQGLRPITSRPTTHAAAVTPNEDDAALRRRIRARVLDYVDLTKLERSAAGPTALDSAVTAALEAICSELGVAADDPTARAELLRELRDEVLGLGPLEALLRDPQVTEIMVVDANTVFAERGGRLMRTASRFTDDESVRAVIERIVTPLGRRIDESSPMVDARLPDGSRVHAVIPPLAVKGPCITIRKFGGAPLSLEDLVARGSLDARVARFLTRAVRARLNIVVAGGTGSGKTTLLNVLSSAIGDHERVVTIEDAAELRLRQCHVVSLEARSENLEGRGAVTIRELVRNALRMRPDRIVVGECRGGEALDMLQAMNTGHEGSMTTTHANSPQEAVARLETLCLMADIPLPLRAIRAQLAASVHLIVQQTRDADGFRSITHVSEVVGMGRNDEVLLEDIFVRRRTAGACKSPRARFELTGYLPRCLDAMVAQGLIEDGEYL